MEGIMKEMAMLQTAEKDNDWLTRNFKKIQQEHPNKFIAISEGHIIAEGGDSEDVINEVEKKGRDSATVLIEFIPEKGLLLIL